jgi:hypothetical protein
MIKNSKDKMIIGGAEISHKATETTEMIPFFFPGSTEYIPITVNARNLEEATEIWREKRKKVDKIN